MDTDKAIALGEQTILRSDAGPVSFGLIISGSVVSWSGADARDVLIGRCWEGVHLYPSRALGDEELSRQPLNVTSPLPMEPFAAVPVARNQDGGDDLIIGDRTGFLYYFERRGEYPDIRFEPGGMLQDEEQHLPINIPYENPNHPVLNDLDGYLDTAFFSYARPIVYPMGDQRTNHLIIGDWAGNLWWLPDRSRGAGRPAYRGVRFTKPEDQIVTRKGKQYVDAYGYDYAKPADKLCDEAGAPLLLGDGYDAGVGYAGGNTKPVLYRDERTGRCDLLVLAGMKRPRLYYLRRIVSSDRDRDRDHHRASPSGDDKPVFQNVGEIDLGSFYEPYKNGHLHSAVIVYRDEDGWNNLMISSENHIAVFRNCRRNGPVPEFRFSHTVSGRNVATAGYNFTEVLHNGNTGRRYLLESKYNGFQFRELTDAGGEIKVSAEGIVLQDQTGAFRLEGETDPQGGKHTGVNRAYRWDFDRSGRQHLIVGTDKGLLYLLIEQTGPDDGGALRYKSAGPLQDRNGQVIKVHNRACACGIDLDGDGVEDLIVGGASYQLGIRSDPRPGGGFYYLLHRGLDSQGLPVLEPLAALPVEGRRFHVRTNTHVHLQAVDIDRDGEKEIVLATQEGEREGWIFKVSRNTIGVRYAGEYIEHMFAKVQMNLMDIDGDGQLELVFAGGENGVGHYRKLNRQDAPLPGSAVPYIREA